MRRVWRIRLLAHFLLPNHFHLALWPNHPSIEIHCFAPLVRPVRLLRVKPDLQNET
jgi:hypothetical protein